MDNEQKKNNSGIFESLLKILVIILVSVAASYFITKREMGSLGQEIQSFPNHKIIVLDIKDIINQKTNEGLSQVDTVLYVQLLTVVLQHKGYLVLERNYVFAAPIKYSIELPSFEALKAEAEKLGKGIDMAKVKEVYSDTEATLKNIFE